MLMADNSAATGEPANIQQVFGFLEKATGIRPLGE